MDIPANINNEGVPPLNLLLILKESGQDLFSLTLPELRNRLQTGVILRDKKENTETQFFWMDETSKLNCFMLLPKSLRINADSFGQGASYVSEEETRNGVKITLPRVKYERARHFKVSGKFGTMGLSPKGEYEVVLLLKLIQTGGPGSIYSASTKKLSLPDGSQTQEPWEIVGRIPPGEWYPFQVGSFPMKPNNVGELSFDIQVYFWGRPDIMIKGVAIKPPPAKI